VKLRIGILAAALAVFAALAPAASAAGVHVYNSPVCGSNYVPVDLGHGNYFNVYNSQNNTSCIDSEQHHLSWTVTRSPSGRWQYPNIGSGIEWGRYTCDDGLSGHDAASTCMKYPVQQYKDGMPVTSARYWPGTLTSGNVAYDIWFNRTDKTPAQVKQDNGTEIMIWLAHPGISVWDVSRTVTVNRMRWQVMTWTASHNGVSWHYVAYVAVTPVRSVSDLWLNQFFREAEAHGELSRDWWLTGIDFGAEMNSGGRGFTVAGYSLSGVN
jgi:hypothetical protein